jgi:adenylosuccinate synthase
VVAREAVRLNGITGLAITKLDVLSGQPALKIANGYVDGEIRHEAMPGNIRSVQRLQPLYEELPGWIEDLRHIRNVDELPAKARAYVRRIEELTETPVVILSVGPGREETMLLRNPFEKTA